MDTGHTRDVALIVPASNTVMESDFTRSGDAAPHNLTVWRIRLDSVTREAEERMLGEELPARLDEIAPTEPDVVVFGCTSAGALGGIAHDSAIARRIHDATGAEAVTVIGAMIEHLDAVAGTRVALFTPYAEELTRAVGACVKESGRLVAMAKGMGLVDNEEIGEMEPGEIVSFVLEGVQGLEADAVFLSCTNWRAVEAIEPLQAALGLPVLTSNQVTLDSVRARLLARSS